MKPRDLQADLDLLEFTQTELKELIDKHKPDWLALNEAFQATVKEHHKKLALKWHPDVCKDPLATERMQEVNVAAEALTHLRLGPRPEPVMQVIHVVMGGSFGIPFGGGWGGTSSTSTSYTTTWNWKMGKS